MLASDHKMFEKVSEQFECIMTSVPGCMFLSGLLTHGCFSLVSTLLRSSSIAIEKFDLSSPLEQSVEICELLRMTWTAAIDVQFGIFSGNAGIDAKI